MLPLIVLPPFLVTLWSGVITWQGANWGGYGWVTGGNRASLIHLERIQRASQPRVQNTANLHVSGMPIELNNNEILVKRSSDGETKILQSKSSAANLIPAKLEPLLIELKRKEHGIFLSDDQKSLFFVSKGQIGADAYLLFEVWDDNFVDQLSRISGTEYTVYTPDGSSILTSWKSKNSSRSKQSIPENILHELQQDSDRPYVVKYAVNVPDYRGLFPEVEGFGQNEGESRFAAYHAFSWVLTASGQKVAILATEIPEGALLNAPARGMIGSLGIFLVLLIFSILIIFKIARKFSDPISSASKNIKKISDSLIQRLSPELRSQLDKKKPIHNDQPEEISELTEVTKKLIAVEHKFNEMEKAVENAQLTMIHNAKFAALGEMAGGIAHEINNPLTVIQGKARQIYNRLNDSSTSTMSPEFLKESSTVINTMVDRISKIIRGLRTFSRTGPKDPFQIAKVVEITNDVIGLCQDKFRMNGIDFRAGNFDDSLSISCRPTQISQVLLNLLNNSFDAVRVSEEKWVTLEVGTLEHHVEISVIDSGKGISETVRDKIMQPFFTTKEIGKGTGLGLSISKSIVEDHGGKLIIDERCENTKFVVTLPLKK